MPTTESAKGNALDLIQQVTGTGQSTATPTEQQPSQPTSQGNGLVSQALAAKGEDETWPDFMRQVFDFKDVWKELILPGVLGMKPLSNKLAYLHQQKVQEAQQRVAFIGEMVKKATSAGSVDQLNMLKPQITSIFGKEGFEAALAAASSRQRTGKIENVLESLAPTLIPEEFNQPVESAQPQQLGGPGMEEGQAAAAPGQAPAQAAPLTPRQRTKLLRRLSFTLDEDGHVKTATVHQQPSAVDQAKNDALDAMPPEVQRAIADMGLYKEAGVTIQRLTDKNTGKEYFAAITPKGQTINLSGEFKTGLTPEEEIQNKVKEQIALIPGEVAKRVIELKSTNPIEIEKAVQEQLAKIPGLVKEATAKQTALTPGKVAEKKALETTGTATESERNYTAYTQRVKAAGKQPLPQEAWAKLPAELDTAAKSFMPPYDPIKSAYIMPSVGEKERKGAGWLHWVNSAVESGNYDPFTLRMKTIEVLSSLGYQLNEIDTPDKLRAILAKAQAPAAAPGGGKK